MLKFNRALLISSLVLTGSTLACGPDFPMMLSSDRAQTFAELTEPVFLVEVQALASTVPDFSAVAAKSDATVFADSYDYQNERWLSATEQAEQQLLSKEQALIVQQMRQSATVQQALTEGEALPAELRFYTAAAVAFAQQDYQQAIELFRQVLALPLEQQQQRRSWALYSLSRVLLRQYDVDHRAEVATLYQQLQQEVAAGLADPLQLAVASLGEQARLAKQQGDWATAIALYAAQSHWSESGRASLLWLSKELAAMPDQELMPLVQIPAVSALLSRYLMTQFSALSYMDPDQLQRLLVVLNQVPDIQLHNATQLAVAAYQQGQFALVEQLVPLLDQTALAFTLRAKMALKAGDTAKAAEFYAKASKSFAPEFTQTKVMPVQQDYYSKVSIEDLQTQHYCRIQAEHGILELSRGDYLQAISLLTAAGMEYWQDTAYIAERVLTLDELINFVALHPVTAVPEKSQWHYFGDTPVEVLLHHLTARRLMRAGEYQQAQAYFVDPELKQLAKRYQSYAEAAQSSWTDNAKAEALFEQAKLARVHGLELLGFELAPDYQVFYGQFEPYEDETKEPTLPLAELQRLGSSASKYNSRFHYRHFAADLSAQAAELVPQNSQAFAATLCHSTKWLLIRQSELAQAFYQKYLQHGPYVSWGAEFGQNCPEPDFVAAKQRQWDNLQLQLRQMLRPFKWGLLALLVAGFGVIGWFGVKRLKRA
ncbi:hypothetical protein Rhein_2902 [Rheinheimera sp. A13L]|uniref:hypothetical protein n=1 Tax=Rheinheimera sp. A13L TaxID=506534 RepID=UPI000212502B|nr:hypothetical protein [Rheinheimera sp. A13L]EGM77003.1 hypothetical protein Rhein_2902 [Rheinheimera sp. A13L]